MKTNDIVRIKKEWCDDPREADMDYIVVEEANVMNRIKIQPVEWKYEIVPTDLVGVEMVEAV